MLGDNSIPFWSVGSVLAATATAVVRSLMMSRLRPEVDRHADVRPYA